MNPRRLIHAVTMAAVIAPMAGCVHAAVQVRPADREFERVVSLAQHPLTLHLARASTGRPLLVYATGDGGWRGKDVDVYRQLISYDYPLVGFSAPEYLKHLGKSKTTRPGPLAADYERIITTAKAALALPAETAVILVGVSRGADLAVVAAGQGVLRHELVGVVAVGLTKEEEYVRRFRRRAVGSGPPERVAMMVQLYDYLPRLGPVPLSVIQSTHDNYLPAADARTLFGPDTSRRQLHPIESRNHSFTDARRQLYEMMHASIEWVYRLHEHLEVGQ